MVELGDDEFMLIKQFIVTDLGNAIQWDDPNMDQTLKEDYINTVQILNSYGPQQTQDIAAQAPA